MISRTVVVGSAVGLHARPAAIVAAAAQELDDVVTLVGEGGEAEVDASSVLMIMTLGAMQGALITVRGFDGAAVNRIADLLECDLDA